MDRHQDGSRGAQEAPRPPQERPKRLQETPKSAPGGSKRPSREPKCRSRGLCNSNDALLRCHITECKAGMPKAGGRAAVSPARGRQSAARPGGARSRRVRSPVAVAEVAKVAQSLAEVVCILLRIFLAESSHSPVLTPLKSPQEASAFRRADTKSAFLPS